MPLFFLKIPSQRRRPSAKPAPARSFRLQRQRSPRRKWLPWVKAGVALSVLGFGALLVAPLFVVALGCGKMGPQFAARSTVGSLNRAQQAYWLEQGRFATSMAALEVGFPVATDDYRYQVVSDGERTVHYAVSQNPDFDTFISAVLPNPQGEATGNPAIDTVAVVCQAETAGEVPLASPTLAQGTLTCPPGFLAL